MNSESNKITKRKKYYKFAFQFHSNFIYEIRQSNLLTTLDPTN